MSMKRILRTTLLSTAGVFAVLAVFLTLKTRIGCDMAIGISMPKLMQTDRVSSPETVLSVLMPNFNDPTGKTTVIASSFWEMFYEQKPGPSNNPNVPGAGEILSMLAADETFSPLEAADTLSVLRTSMHPTDKSSYIVWNNAFIKNRSIQTFDIDSLMREKLELELNGRPEGPLVLIYHSHTTEGYNTTGDTYANPDVTHSTDNEKNVVAVGAVLAQTLEAYGIETIHCTERLDTSYNRAYYASEDKVEEILAEYPSIRVVIDLHRDAIYSEGGAKYRPVVSVDELDVAQVMIIAGTGDDGNDANVHWQDNLRFGVTLHDKLESMCPGMTRALTVRTSSFNQYLSKGGLLIEMGTTGNTLTEAKRSAYYIGVALQQILKENGG